MTITERNANLRPWSERRFHETQLTSPLNKMAASTRSEKVPKTRNFSTSRAEFESQNDR